VLNGFSRDYTTNKINFIEALSRYHRAKLYAQIIYHQSIQLKKCGFKDIAGPLRALIITGFARFIQGR